MAKERVDILLVRKGFTPSREKAKILIMAGEVFIGTERLGRPDLRVDEGAPIEVRKNILPYVSYGGIKLEDALTFFHIDVRGRVTLDIGSSTGGFTDCLLQAGAIRVHALDTGTNQLHERLWNDPRVVLKENFNARYLAFEDIGEEVGLITIDVSFISLKKILPPAIPLLAPGGTIISLVKPQFEVGRYNVGKGGIVKDDGRIEAVLDDIKTFGESLGITPVNTREAPRERERKNREFFVLWE